MFSKELETFYVGQQVKWNEKAYRLGIPGKVGEGPFFVNAIKEVRAWSCEHQREAGHLHTKECYQNIWHPQLITVTDNNGAQHDVCGYYFTAASVQ